MAQAQPYRVKPGETLYRIALHAGLSEQTIQRANPELRGGHTVYAGQVLNIPPQPLPPGSFRVRKGESLKRLARRLGVGEADLRRANPGIDRRGSLNAGQVLRLPARLIAAQRKAEQMARQKLAQQKLARQKLAQQKLAQQKLAQQKLAQQRAAQQRAAQQKQQAALNRAAAAKKAVAAQAAAAKVAAAKKPRPTTHRVQFGDTFFNIARRYAVNPIALQSYNPQYAGRTLEVGTVLTLRAPRPRPVVAVRRAPAPAAVALIPARPLPAHPTPVRPVPTRLVPVRPAPVRLARVAPARSRSVWEWPLPGHGRVTSDFGWRTLGGEREMHRGIDVAAPPGTPVIAARSGRVIQAGLDNTYGWGWTVVIQHPDGWQTRYAHMSGVSVQARQLVRQGERVGAVGSTGRVTGPHLHFGLYRNWDPHNPLAAYAGGAD